MAIDTTHPPSHPRSDSAQTARGSQFSDLRRVRRLRGVSGHPPAAPSVSKGLKRARPPATPSMIGSRISPATFPLNPFSPYLTMLSPTHACSWRLAEIHSSRLFLLCSLCWRISFQSRTHQPIHPMGSTRRQRHRPIFRRQSRRHRHAVRRAIALRAPET